MDRLVFRPKTFEERGRYLEYARGGFLRLRDEKLGVVPDEIRKADTDERIRGEEHRDGLAPMDYLAMRRILLHSAQ